jgi:hypothetical protein
MVAAVLIGGAITGVAGAAIGAHGAQSAASTQANAANDASATQLAMFNQTRQSLLPYMTAGTTSLSGLNAFMGINPDGTTNPNAPGLQRFTGADLANDPGYQFQLQQGNNAILNSRSAMGGVLSGATLKDLTSFSQGLAGTTFNDAWKRFNTDQASVYDRYFNMTGMGENAAAGVGTMGVNTASSIGANTIAAGNAQAAGQVGTANAYSGGLSNIYNQWLMSQFLAGSGMPGSGAGPG